MIQIGQFRKVRCTTCGASVELWKPEEIPEKCPSCGDYFGDMLQKQGGGTGLEAGEAIEANPKTGLTTANTYFNLGGDERASTD